MLRARLRIAPALALATLCAAAGARATPAPVVFGFAAAGGGSFDSPPTFLDGGLGKLLDGAAPLDASAAGFAGEARLALDWEPGTGWHLFVHGVARRDAASADSGSGSGLLEAYGERLFGFGAGHEIALRLGQFFLPSSRENVDPLWSSPYTLTLSALNSWIAEEVRPIGLDARYSRAFASGHRLALAGTLFGGNDTSGTLLGWRGFSFHARPTPTFEQIPLPRSIGLDATFPAQDRGGTRPFGDELDGRPGFAGRVRWDAPAERAVVQATLFYNDGDRALHGSEYAWRTDFRWLSTEVELPAGFRALGEWGSGVSRMGFLGSGESGPAAVDIAFDTFYLLLSWQRGALRAALRYDDFKVDDRDATAGDDNREDGSAWTAALMFHFGDRWRVGLELLDLEAERPAAASAGVADLDGRSALLELRCRFGG
jgi:hypothetical protein